VRVVSVVALAALGATAGVATAGGEVDLLSPRAIGHAGASLVSDDGGAAAFVCPAAIARRDGARGQLAGLIVDDDVWLDAGPGHPRVRDLGPAELLPSLGVQVGWGRIVLGASLAVTESIDRRLPTPAPGLPDAAVIADHPHRYAGTDARWTRTTAALAVAVRATDWLAVGAALTLGRVDAGEERRLWAGFSGRDPVGTPGRDVTVAIAADDPLVPGATVGALVAPAEVPLELGVGVAWADDVRLAGPATIAAVRSPPSIDAAAAQARARFGSALTLAAGVRWLGERWAVEAGATAWTYPTGHDGWTIDGARVIDDSGATAAIAGVPTRLTRRSHGAVRASLDVELAPGFLWMSAGWSWRGAGTPAARTTTTTIGLDPGGHTLGAGMSVSAGAATITLGVARQLARTVTVEAPGLPLDNPFGGGGEPANLGAHGRSRDLVGVGVELAW